MFLNRQEQRQDNQNGVIFSGWLCSLLGRNAQGASQTRPAVDAVWRFYLFPYVTKRVPSALVSIMAGYPGSITLA
jgi:hypothetical protein